MTTGLATALIGLGGVIGAAIVAAFAAIFGPSLLHRLQRRAKSEDDAATKRDATIRRLVEFRTTGRSWFDALELLADDFGAGRALALDAFDDIVRPLRDGATRAIYEMALDDEWVASGAAGTTEELVMLLNEQVEEENLLGDEARRAKAQVLDSLRHATKLLRDDVRANRGVDDQRISPDTWEAIDNIRRARAELNSNLLLLIEKMTSE